SAQGPADGARVLPTEGHRVHGDDAPRVLSDHHPLPQPGGARRGPSLRLPDHRTVPIPLSRRSARTVGASGEVIVFAGDPFGVAFGRALHGAVGTVWAVLTEVAVDPIELEIVH